MNEKTLKILKLLFLVLALSLIGIGVSRAYFSDQAKVEDNTVTTGTWGD